MLAYLERNLTKSERKKTARYMSQYHHIQGIIESRRSELMPSTTATININPVQESNYSDSEADTYLKKKLYVEELELAVKQMDIIYKSLKPIHKMIWNEHFIKGFMDFEIYYDGHNELTRRTYYREKNRLLCIVAEALDIGTKM